MKQGESVWCVAPMPMFVLVFQATIIYEADGIVRVMEANRFNVANGVARLPEWDIPVANVFHLQADALARAKTLKPKGKKPNNKGGRP